MNYKDLLKKFLIADLQQKKYFFQIFNYNKKCQKQDYLELGWKRIGLNLMAYQKI